MAMHNLNKMRFAAYDSVDDQLKDAYNDIRYYNNWVLNDRSYDHTFASHELLVVMQNICQLLRYKI